jgi:hypothetical protein
MSIYAESRLTIDQDTMLEVLSDLSKRFNRLVPDQVIGEEAKVRMMFMWDSRGGKVKVTYDMDPRSGSPYAARPRKMQEELPRLADDWIATNCNALLAKRAAEKEGYKVTEEWQEATQTPVLVCEGGGTDFSSSTVPDFTV